MLTNKNVIDYMKVLNRFGSVKLPSKICYAIMKNTNILSKEYECYDKSLTNILNTYREYMEFCDDGNVRVDNRGIPIVAEKMREDFENDLYNLLGIEVNVNLYKIPIELFDYEDLNGRYDVLTPNDLYSLQSILCEGGD